MRKVLLLLALLSLVSFGLVACDSGGSSANCKSAVNSWIDLAKEKMKTPAGSEKEFKNAFVEACKETNAEKDHKEALKCMTEASSKSDMEECDNAEKMTKKWAKKAMKVMKKKMKNK